MTTGMGRFSNLSPELIVLIAKQLDTHGLASLSGTSRYYHALADPVRFKRAAASTSSKFLFWAANHGRLSVVQRLVDFGVDVNREDASGLLPPELFHGSEYPSDTDAEVLDGSAEPPVPAGHWTALHLAAANGHIDIVDLLLESGADLEAEARGLCKCGQDPPAYWEDGVQNIFPGADPVFTPLHFAVCKGQDAMTDHLLRAKASLRHTDFTALHYAVAYGSLEAVRTIVEADPELLEAYDVSWCKPLTYAYRRRRFDDIIPYLIQEGVDINAPIGPSQLRIDRDVGLLLLACYSRAYPNVVKLVGLGADVHAKDPGTSMTALHACCSEDLAESESNFDLDYNPPSRREIEKLQFEGHRLQAVKVLLEAGADVNAREAAGTTPLCYAVQSSALPATITLLESGADPLSCAWESCLMCVARTETRPVRGIWDDQVRLFKCLVDAGVDVNFKSGHKETVLHLLCKIAARLISNASNEANVERSIEHIKTLMTTGRIDHSLKDGYGKLAIEYALHRPTLLDLFPINKLQEVLTTSDLIRIRDTTKHGWRSFHGPPVLPVLEFLHKIDSHFVYERAETLYTVILGGAQDAALQLIDKGASTCYISMAGENLLHVACRSRLDKVIQRLCDVGFTMNQATKTGDTPLSLYIDAAIQLSLGGMVNWETCAAVPFIVKHGGDPHQITHSFSAERLSYDYEWHQRPLDRLLSRSEHDMARQILDMSPPPPLALDSSNTSGYSYLHRACSFAHKVPDLDFVRYLLSFEHLDINGKNAYGRTVLSEVVRSMVPTKPWVSPFYRPQSRYPNDSRAHSQLYSPLAHAHEFLECITLLENHGADWWIECTGMDDFGEEFEISPAAELKQILDRDVDGDDEISRAGLEIIESMLLDREWNPDETMVGCSPFIRGTEE